MNEVSHIPSPPRLVDCTLREGAQAAGVRFGEAQTGEIAQALLRAGLDMVECGHPAVGETEQRRVRAAVAVCGQVPVLAHARACGEDIDSVAATGAAWVGIFAGVKDLSRSARIGAGKPVLELVRKSVAHARERGFKVRYTVEDGSRTDWDELVAGFRAALEAGADRICLADTVGILCPWEVEAVAGRLVRTFPGVELEVHCHDDRGMANANALAELFAFGWYVGTSAWIAGVRLVHGDGIVLGPGGLRSVPYPSPTAPSAQDLAEAIAGSVRRCLQGAGPFGLAVSGGLDSTILAWELNDAGIEELVTLSVRVPVALRAARSRFKAEYGGCADLREVECPMRLARLLLRTDLCLMSQSIEGRVPYLHNGIPELALSLPWAGLVAGAGKTALREAYRRRLGPRAEVRKVRFKASDALLLAALRALAVEGRILDGVAPVFGRLRARAALDLLATPDGFDPDLCCLLLSLAWLA